MYHPSMIEWIVIAIAGLVSGFSKTGMPGCGILAVPLFAMVIGGQKSVGALLPMLIFADIFAVVFYVKFVDRKRFLQLLPWALLGVVGGYFGCMFVSSDTLMNRIIGLVVILMLALNRLRKHYPALDAKVPRNWAFAAVCGLAAGVVTMMANGAGPIMMLYLLAMDFDKEKFIGTASAYFFTVNLFKVPFHVSLGNITWESLKFSAMLFPAVLAGALGGKYVFPHIPRRFFMIAVEILSAAAAVKLLVG